MCFNCKKIYFNYINKTIKHINENTYIYTQSKHGTQYIKI